MKEDELDKKQLLKPVNMLNLYAQGAFPMADENGEIDWYQPKERTVITLNDYNIPRSLRKFMQTSNFEYKLNTDTIEIIKACADRTETWISEELIDAYKALIEIEYLHSIGVYKSKILVGGLYGVSIGGAFFGESMFSKVSQASKSALAVLLKHLDERMYTLLDVQFQTGHLKMFGTKQIDFFEYNDLLDIAYRSEVEFL